MRIPLALTLCLVSYAAWQVNQAQAKDAAAPARVRMVIECDAALEAQVRKRLHGLNVRIAASTRTSGDSGIATPAPSAGTSSAGTRATAKTYGMPAVWAGWQAMLRAAANAGVTLERVRIDPSRIAATVRSNTVAAVDAFGTALKSSAAVRNRMRADRPLALGTSVRRRNGDLRSHVVLHFGRHATYEDSARSTWKQYPLGMIESLVVGAGLELRRAGGVTADKDRAAGRINYWSEFIVKSATLEQLQALVISIERKKGLTVYDVRYDMDPDEATQTMQRPMIRVGYWESAAQK